MWTFEEESEKTKGCPSYPGVPEPASFSKDRLSLAKGAGRQPNLDAGELSLSGATGEE